MHGLFATSLQNFVTDVYGVDAWRDVAGRLRRDADGFERLLTYPDTLGHRLIDAAATRLGKSCGDLMEDLGIYLVSHPNTGRLRRLLRFGGSDFAEFLESLDDLPARARLAVGELEIPALRVECKGMGTYRVICGPEPFGIAHAILGALRAMADDYGALAFVEFAKPRALAPVEEDCAVIEITVLSTSFSSGRSFELAGAPL